MQEAINLKISRNIIDQSLKGKKMYNSKPSTLYKHTHIHIPWPLMQDGRGHLNSFKKMGCVVGTRMTPHHKDMISSKLPKSAIRVCCRQFYITLENFHFPGKETASERLCNFPKITDLSSSKAYIY